MYLSLTSVLAYIGSLFVSLGSLMMAGGDLLQPAQPGSLAYKPAKYDLDGLVQCQVCVAWPGNNDVGRETRKKQTGLTSKCQCRDSARMLMQMVCISMD